MKTQHANFSTETMSRSWPYADAKPERGDILADDQGFGVIGRNDESIEGNRD